jgi:hypothetical protein
MRMLAAKSTDLLCKQIAIDVQMLSAPLTRTSAYTPVT